MRRKSIFDAVRAMLGRGFRQSEVDALDRALDAASVGSLESGTADTAGDLWSELFDTNESSPARKYPLARPSSISPAGIALIKRFEGCASLRSDGMVQAYPDPGTGGAPWTIGWGATGAGIERGTVWTRNQCDARLENDLVRYAADVARALGDAPRSQHQFDALVSFHYNTGAIARATLTARHRAGDHAGAVQQFARWNRAGGRVMKGLARRRAAEADLYRLSD